MLHYEIVLRPIYPNFLAIISNVSAKFEANGILFATRRMLTKDRQMNENAENDLDFHADQIQYVTLPGIASVLTAWIHPEFFGINNLYRPVSIARTCIGFALGIIFFLLAYEFDL